MARAAVIPGTSPQRTTRPAKRTNPVTAKSAGNKTAAKTTKARAPTSATENRKRTARNALSAASKQVEDGTDEDTDDELGFVETKDKPTPAKPRGRPAGSTTTGAGRGRKPAASKVEKNRQEDLADGQKKRAGRPKAKPIAETVPKQRGRPKGSTTKSTTASDPTKDNTLKNAHVRASLEAAAYERPTELTISTNSTLARSNLLRGPAKKKTVTFKDLSDSEDALSEPSPPPAGRRRTAATAERQAGLGAKPARKTGTAAGRGRKPAAAKKGASKPLSPKKATQVAKGISSYASDGEDDELSSTKDPIKLQVDSPNKHGSESTGLSSPVKRINFNSNQPSKPVDENGEPMLQPPKSIDFSDATFMSSPARRPPPSPFNYTIRETPRRGGFALRDNTNHISQPDLTPTRNSPLKLSPKKAHIDTPKRGNIGLFDSMAPLSQPNFTPGRNSPLKSSPKKGLFGASFQRQPSLEESSTPMKRSLLQSPAKKVTTPFKSSLFAQRSPVTEPLELHSDLEEEMDTVESPMAARSPFPRHDSEETIEMPDESEEAEKGLAYRHDPQTPEPEHESEDVEKQTERSYTPSHEVLSEPSEHSSEDEEQDDEDMVGGDVLYNANPLVNDAEHAEHDEQYSEKSMENSDLDDEQAMDEYDHESPEDNFHADNTANEDVLLAEEEQHDDQLSVSGDLTESIRIAEQFIDSINEQESTHGSVDEDEDEEMATYVQPSASPNAQDDMDEIEDQYDDGQEGHVDAPENTLEDAPEDLPQNLPEEIPGKVPEDVTEDFSNHFPKDASGDVTEDEEPTEPHAFHRGEDLVQGLEDVFTDQRTTEMTTDISLGEDHDDIPETVSDHDTELMYEGHEEELDLSDGDGDEFHDEDPTLVGSKSPGWNPSTPQPPVFTPYEIEEPPTPEFYFNFPSFAFPSFVFPSFAPPRHPREQYREKAEETEDFGAADATMQTNIPVHDAHRSPEPQQQAGNQDAQKRRPRFTLLAEQLNQWKVGSPEKTEPSRPRRRGVFSLSGNFGKSRNIVDVPEDVSYPDLSGKSPTPSMDNMQEEGYMQAEGDLQNEDHLQKVEILQEEADVESEDDLQNEDNLQDDGDLQEGVAPQEGDMQEEHNLQAEDQLQDEDDLQDEDNLQEGDLQEDNLQEEGDLEEEDEDAQFSFTEVDPVSPEMGRGGGIENIPDSPGLPLFEIFSDRGAEDEEVMEDMDHTVRNSPIRFDFGSPARSVASVSPFKETVLEDDKENYNLPPPAPATPIKKTNPLQTFHTVSKVPLKPEGEISPLKLSRKRGRSLSITSPTRSSPRLRRSSIAPQEEESEPHPPRKMPRLSQNTVPQLQPTRRRSSSRARTDSREAERRKSPARSPSPSKSPRRRSSVYDPKPAGPLGGAVVYVDVHTTEGEDASGIFVELLQQMGARCVKNWSWNPRSTLSLTEQAEAKDGKVGITHVVYKDGGVRTLEKVRHAASLVKCVGVGWVLDCERENKWLDEAHYAVDCSIIPRGGAKRRKSMEPRALSHVNGTLVKGDATASASRRSGIGAADDMTPTPRLAPSTPKRSKRYETSNTGIDQRYFQTPKTPGHMFNLDTIGMSPATPFYLSQRSNLVQQTCPPKQIQKGLFSTPGPSADHSQKLRAKLEAARRKSLAFKPRIGSSLAE
ncbi:hypothetical protein BDV25DRAFT_159220 [Aspergillus avenaceus]|uniref:BRCT domain-containing protein n=1 Tax=Aspergillus avenaceus TaxID=36643 RepID=A0A5N6TNS4_ASPAV|nr:hypothetical protein BDV25DRAFT_159220 [Aspergillus avenaceus]